MEKKFNTGDVVVMIADGPKMAVEGYLLEEDASNGQLIESDEFVNVVFFAGDGFKRDTFHQELLLFVDDLE